VNHLFLNEFCDFDYHDRKPASSVGALMIL
jgi:hypothetical protein